jgi:hypothetical protein
MKRMYEGAHKWSSDVYDAELTRQTNGTLFVVD